MYFTLIVYYMKTRMWTRFNLFKKSFISEVKRPVMDKNQVLLWKYFFYYNGGWGSYTQSLSWETTDPWKLYPVQV